MKVDTVRVNFVPVRILVFRIINGDDSESMSINIKVRSVDEDRDARVSNWTQALRILRPVTVAGQGIEYVIERISHYVVRVG